MHIQFAFYLLLAITLCYAGDKRLVAVHGSARHGERGANYRVRNLNVAFDYINGGNTGADLQDVGVTIAPVGFRNSYALGVFLRERYQNYDFINRENQTLLTRIRSTDYGRIQEVANAFADGFFGSNFTVPGSTTGECVLPSCYAAPWIPQNPEIFPYKNCHKYGTGFMEKAENSVMTKYEAFLHDEFIALVEANATLADWFYNVWVPRTAGYYPLGIRLNSTGGVYMAGRGVQVELRDGYAFMIDNLITVEELNNPVKFGGLLSAMFSLVLPTLDVVTSHQYASMPYIEVLIRELLTGNDPTASSTHSSIEGNVYKPDQRPMFYFDMGHSQTRDYRLYPMNPAQFSYAAQGDFVLFELWEDESTGERFVETFKGTKFLSGEEFNFTIDEITPPTCSNFTCPVDEWLENLEYYTFRDTTTECSNLPRCVSETQVTSEWSTGAIYSIDVTSGWDEFGWTLQLTFNHSNFVVQDVWQGQLLEQSGAVVTIGHLSSHNYEAPTDVALIPIGMKISKSASVSVPVVIEARFYNSDNQALLVCDTPEAKKRAAHMLRQPAAPNKVYTTQEIFDFFEKVDLA